MKRFWIALICVYTTLFVVMPAVLGQAHWNQGGGSGGGGAPTDAQYITLANDGDLSQERVFVSGTSFITLTDGGANGNLTIDIATLAVADGGTGATTAAGALANLHGTPTKGRIAVANGTIWTVLSVGTDGQSLIADSGAANGVSWGAPGGLDSEPYITQALSSNLSAERVITGGTGISLTDGGANGNLTIDIDSTVATLTGTQTLSNKTLSNPVINDTLVFEKGANDVTITATAPSGARSYNFPDVGGSSDIIISAGSQTLAGQKTFTLAPVLSSGTVSVSGQTITIPGSTDTVVLLAQSQTLTNKTLTSPVVGTNFVLDDANDITITWDNPAAVRQVNIEDYGANADLVAKEQSHTFTNRGVLWTDGTVVKSTDAGTNDYYLKQSAAGPVWATVSGGGASMFRADDITSTLKTFPTTGTISGGTYVVSGNWTSTGVITASGPIHLLIDGNFTLDHDMNFTAIDNGGTKNGQMSTTTAEANGGGGGLGPGWGGVLYNGGGGGGSAAGADGGEGGSYYSNSDGGQKGRGYHYLQGLAGSGGGSGGTYQVSTPNGGNGGSWFVLECTGSVDLNASINCDGTAGTAQSTASYGGAGGGGGAGSIIIFCDSFDLASGEELSCDGGAGGAESISYGGAGAGGAGGFIWIVTRTATLTNNGTLSVSGGAKGSQTPSAYDATAGENGTSTTESSTEPISFLNIVPITVALRRRRKRGLKKCA